MLAGWDWWISIRSVDNVYDWRKFWKRFRGCFVFETRVSTKTVVNKNLPRLSRWVATWQTKISPRHSLRLFWLAFLVLVGVTWSCFIFYRLGASRRVRSIIQCSKTSMSGLPRERATWSLLKTGRSLERLKRIPKCSEAKTKLTKKLHT